MNRRESGLREGLIDLLSGGDAHPNVEEAIADFPAALRGRRVPGAPHTAWRLLEHMRLAQWDILEFSRSPEHVPPSFPDGYWPEGDEPPEPGAWELALASFGEDLQAMRDLVVEAPDLIAPFAHGDGQNLLREVLLVADHNAYHLGQLVQLRRVLEASG
jgi:hypothetical protein